ncbi:phosphodiesterase/alkaline phosphatase D-like protein [Nitzschia inconspicua]|uniref:Phosphodiesterase/alkaline phosphatase D-like protein n=1 Tax=Nitzschia inconspicua TaxID=303405 RepID=A0A9K3M226_9STRA|nr:phosphodiesterase/alkaline phosphatase D-like protein [Nitzschia inconspicua]
MESSTRRPSRIAFGSCNEQNMQNDLWPIIASRNPTAFVWGGDAIYADSQGAIDWTTFPPQSTHQCATPSRLRALYQTQLRNPGYRALLEQNVTIFGTFDDHDFGCDNGDGTFEHKYESGLEYVNFIDLPVDSVMRRRAEAGYGVYGVKVFDFARPVGHQEVSEWEAGIDADIDMIHEPTSFLSNQTVAVFVLDVRSNKSPWKKGSERFKLDFDGDYLGERQWQWFESSIRRSRANVNVILNGLQVHASRYPDGNVAESWERYPRAQQRLFDALLQDGVESPVLISGDVHKTEFMRKDCVRKGQEHSKRRRSLIEMTTSGMTHSWGTLSRPLSDPDFRPTLFEQYQSFASNVLLHSMHNLSPWNDIMKVSPDNAESMEGLFENGGGEGAFSGLQYSLQQNFGELEFDWVERTVALRSIGKKDDSPPLLMAKVSMDQLSGRASLGSPHLSVDDFLAEKETDRHQLYDSDWICLNHRGRETGAERILGHVSTMFILVTVVPMPFLLPIFSFLLLLRRWSQRSCRFESLVNQPRGTKRRFLKRMVKSKIPKGIRRRYKTYTSFAKHNFKANAKFKVTKGSNRSIPVCVDLKDMHQFA